MARARNPLPRSQALVEWIQDHYGQGKAYPNPRQWSLQLGRGPNLIAEIETRGRAAPDTLIEIADSVGESRARLLQLAGWLSAKDFKQTLSDREARVVQLFRQLPPAQSDALEQAARALLGTASGPGARKRRTPSVPRRRK
ncbi:MAG: hypothetical protein FJ318_09850 [SAR202 cluster bacterium]|nr:hypothetical protein [SAR202 cluster bacterium]